jgi:hypothetical protein
MDTAMRKLASGGGDALNDQFRRCENLVRKWNINLIALLLLTAGGQRPQVFG